MTAEPLTIFTWGYWGWGTTTDHLVKTVDAVERARGFEPPIFVDIRISRKVRAPGFVDEAFMETVGEERYYWLSDLGNLAIRKGGEMRLKDPLAVGTLLGTATVSALRRRRVIFFCACEFPGIEGINGCHRTMAARLLLKTAESRRIPLRVIEWPGGEPDANGREVRVSKAARLEPPVFGVVRRTRQATRAAGCDLPANATIVVFLAAANRDPTIFSNPDAFVPTRRDGPSIIFGWGRHTCPGLALAQRTLKSALDALRMLPGRLRLVEPIEYRRHDPLIRGPRRLLVKREE